LAQIVERAEFRFDGTTVEHQRVVLRAGLLLVFAESDSIAVDRAAPPLLGFAVVRHRFAWHGLFLKRVLQEQCLAKQSKTSGRYRTRICDLCRVKTNLNFRSTIANIIFGPCFTEKNTFLVSRLKVPKYNPGCKICT
jgi:hypothetical protein